MKSKLIGAVVAPISIVGLTFALGLGVTAFGVGEQQQNLDDTLISTLDVTTEVDVAPWCGWYVSGTETADLALEPDAGAPTEYIGTEIALTATADQNTAYVGPQAGLTSQGETTHCSWFNDIENKYGARYDVVASSNQFTAEALLIVDGAVTPTADTDMNFTATAGNALAITNVGIDTCAAEGFTTQLGAEIADASLETTPWTVLEASVTNNNFCQWEAKYEIKIPAAMSPVYGNVTYRWTGPTLTHTLVIPEDQ